MHLASMINRNDLLAIHPSWSGEFSSVAASIDTREKHKHEYLKQVMGRAYTDNLAVFNEDDVFQISENEYYSYGDGIRYHKTESGKRIALIFLYGVLWDWSYHYLLNQIKAASNDAYHGALILADSPGGMVKGMRKVKNAINDYEKPIGVFVSGHLNSAAAYVTAGADFIYADPEEKNSFGSIGVFTVRQNLTKKLENEGVETKVFRSQGADLKFKPNEYEPWEQKDLDAIQAAVDADAKDFQDVMTSLRKIEPSSMTELIRGGELDNESAAKHGLHDGTHSYIESIEAIENFKLSLFI